MESEKMNKKDKQEIKKEKRGKEEKIMQSI